MMRYDGVIEIYDMTKFYEVGEIVGYSHFHKPNRLAYDQRETPKPQYGDVWRVVSYNAKILPYSLAYANPRITSDIVRSKIEKVKRDEQIKSILR